jgi:hypothetical protein
MFIKFKFVKHNHHRRDDYTQAVAVIYRVNNTVLIKYILVRTVNKHQNPYAYFRLKQVKQPSSY